jgi:hypothetical protein
MWELKKGRRQLIKPLILAPKLARALMSRIVDRCVMKKEKKDASTKPESRTDGTPDVVRDEGGDKRAG